MTPESKLKQEIKDYLDSLGERCWHVAYHNMGYGRAGVPDRIICYRGRFIGIEAKRASEKAKKHQKMQHDLIVAAGGLADVADCVDDVRAVIEQIDLDIDGFET